MGDNASKTHFTRNLLHWNSKDNDRKMPWKGERILTGSGSARSSCSKPG